MSQQALVIFPWAVGLVLTAAALLFPHRPLSRLLRLCLRSLGGLAALAALHPLSALTGVSLGVNWVNALVLGVLGAPGFGLLLMLQWVLQKA